MRRTRGDVRFRHPLLRHAHCRPCIAPHGATGARGRRADRRRIVTRTNTLERATRTLDRGRKRRQASKVRGGCEACASLGKYGPCTWHAAEQALGRESLSAWNAAAGEVEGEEPKADVHVVYVRPSVAAMYAHGAENVLSVTYTPDDLACVEYVSDAPEGRGRARLVPFGLLQTEEAMRKAIDGREHWTRYRWSTRKGRPAMSIRCRCGQTYPAKWRHACAFLSMPRRIVRSRAEGERASVVWARLMDAYRRRDWWVMFACIGRLDRASAPSERWANLRGYRDGVTPPDTREWVKRERAERRKVNQQSAAARAREALARKRAERRASTPAVGLDARLEASRAVMAAHAAQTFAEAEALRVD